MATATPSSDSPLIYRSAARAWLKVSVWSIVAVAALCASNLIQNDAGPLTARQLAKNSDGATVFQIWLLFCIGASCLVRSLLLVLTLLRFCVHADERGLRWRSFIEWHNACWDEITDCLVKTNISGAQIFIGSNCVDLDMHNPNWPDLRDFIAARVSLPNGLQAWHQWIKLDAEARRIQARTKDDGAALMARSSRGDGAILGLLLCGVYAFSLHNETKNIRPSSFVLLFMAVGLFVLWPAISQLRDFIRADDDGLLIGQILRQKRVRWGDIEDLFLLKKQRKSQILWSPCVVVAGETIELSIVGKARDAMLNRIEARAIYSRSRQFGKREFAPVGKALALPVTLEACPTFAHLLRQNALLATVFAGSAALMAYSVANIGWENFGSSRGMLAWVSALWALLLGAWLRRIIQKSRTRRARGAYRILADDAGLSLENAREFVCIEWAQIARLERDCTSIWDTVFRIESANGAAIEWDRGLAKSSWLASVAREKSGQNWQDSARVSRLMSGFERTHDALLISDNNVISRYWAWAWLGMWALIPSVQICSWLFNPSSNKSGASAGLLFLLAPPVGFVLYLGLAVLLSIARVRTRCDADGLTHRGWFATHQMKWQDVAEIGLGGNGFWDFVRARDGKIIRMWMFPLTEAGLARHELRAEIKRRAPHAQGGWKTVV